ncbi:hypothetical protein DFH29DRAFT_1007431 [Suillus ampliporus]|nr:hypothetical protein DFH29DRAFT_1007431 [Suillus ampliporus]
MSENLRDKVSDMGSDEFDMDMDFNESGVRGLGSAHDVVEDVDYSLGEFIFDVNLQIAYGEGDERVF